MTGQPQVCSATSGSARLAKRAPIICQRWSLDPTDTQLAPLCYGVTPVAMCDASVANDVLEQPKSNAYDGLI